MAADLAPIANLNLFGILPTGVAIRRGDSLAVNPALERITGWAASDLSTVQDWFERLFGDQAEAQRALHVAQTPCDRGARVISTLRPDGTFAHLEIRVSPLVPGSGFEIWTVCEVSKRFKESERHRVLFESTTAHLLFDDTGIIACNQAAVEMLGYRDKKHLMATHPAQFSPEYQPDGRTSAEKSVEMDATARKLGLHKFEWIHRRADGTDIPVEVTLKHVTLADGPVLLVLWHDLTAQKESERVLAQARDSAVDATRAKSGFLANMSHELRTPLNAIIGYSEMLAEDAPEFGADLAKISEAGRHLLTLINDILDLSKIEAGRLDLHPEWVEVAEVVASVVDTTAPAASRNGNVVEVDLSGHAGRLYADPTRLRQVLLNLLGNSAKFTRGGKLGVRVRRSTRGGTVWADFEVWDTGIGIAADKLDRIFDEFVQADASTTRKYGGTGLGLAITRRLCRMMGGDILVTSTPGVGSTFTVTVPASGAAQVVVQKAGSPLTQVVNPSASTVVVIDDDANARELIRRTLERSGYEAVLAPSGALGIELCRRRRPVAITLDVLMPGEDGWQVLAALKADPELATIPVIMVSMVSDRTRGFALGASHHLTKPVSRDQLLAALAQHHPEANGAGSVLVVEDDDALREMVNRTLSRAGWSVEVARNGADALLMLAGHKPDLVLLDLMMPVMDGFDFLAHVRSKVEYQSLPVVVVTARDLSAPELDRLRHQAQGVLQKAVTSQVELLKQVEATVRSYTHPSAVAPSSPAPG